MNIFLIKQKGSIALISLLIISAFTLILAVSMVESSISTGQQFVNNTSEDTSYYGAEGCAEEAMIRIEGDSTFAGGTVAYDWGTCDISVSGTTTKTITITLTQDNYSETYQAVVTVTESGHAINTSLSEWEEI